MKIERKKSLHQKKEKKEATVVMIIRIAINVFTLCKAIKVAKVCIISMNRNNRLESAL